MRYIYTGNIHINQTAISHSNMKVESTQCNLCAHDSIRLQIMQQIKWDDMRKRKWPLGKMCVLHKQSLWVAAGNFCGKWQALLASPACHFKLQRSNIRSLTSTQNPVWVLLHRDSESSSVPLIIIDTILFVLNSAQKMFQLELLSIQTCLC